MGGIQQESFLIDFCIRISASGILLQDDSLLLSPVAKAAILPPVSVDSSDGLTNQIVALRDPKPSAKIPEGLDLYLPSKLEIALAREPQ